MQPGNSKGTMPTWLPTPWMWGTYDFLSFLQLATQSRSLPISLWYEYTAPTFSPLNPLLPWKHLPFSIAWHPVDGPINGGSLRLAVCLPPLGALWGRQTKQYPDNWAGDTCTPQRKNTPQNATEPLATKLLSSFPKSFQDILWKSPCILCLSPVFSSSDLENYFLPNSF